MSPIPFNFKSNCKFACKLSALKTEMSCIAKWRNVRGNTKGGGDGICSACLHNWVQSIWTLIIGRITSEGEGGIHMRSEVKTYNILVQSPATQSLYLHCTAFHIYTPVLLCVRFQCQAGDSMYVLSFICHDHAMLEGYFMRS